MQEAAYIERREKIETYFDRTAADAWARLTSDAPVSGIRATVRAGREQMRHLIAKWVAPTAGARILDAGCGTGLLAVDLARMGARVTAIDLSPTLVELAEQRVPTDIDSGSIRFLSGDMLDASLGEFEHVVAMDSLIHYAPIHAVTALEALAPRVRSSMVFTFAPSNPLLMVMMTVGRLFPRTDRSPQIVPVRFDWLAKALAQSPKLSDWRIGRTERVSKGFYTSQALELIRR